MTLIERLESAEQGSRELDAEVRDFVDPPHPLRMSSLGEFRAKIRDKTRSLGDAPPVTTDLSAAVALVERVLPGWCWRVERVPAEMFVPPSDFWAEVMEPGYLKRTDDIDSEGFSHSPALALCIALLKALKTKEPSA